MRAVIKGFLLGIIGVIFAVSGLSVLFTQRGSWTDLVTLCIVMTPLLGAVAAIAVTKTHK
jgi:hypothetical protein